MAGHVWNVDELVKLSESAEQTPTKRGPYTKTRAERNDPEISA